MITVIFSLSVGIVMCAGMFLSWRDREIVATWIILLGSFALLFGIPNLNKLFFGLTGSGSALVTFIIILIFVVGVRLLSACFCKPRMI